MNTCWKNGRKLPKERSDRATLTMARDVLDAGGTFAILRNGTRIEAVEVLQFGIVKWSDDSFLDGLDEHGRLGTSWKK